jgi:TolB protein
MPDGRILYRTVRQSRSLIIMNFDGSNPITILTDETAIAPAVSPDGRQVVFMAKRGDNWDVYGMNIDGSGLRQLTTTPQSDGLPTWSPEGNAIAFVSNRSSQWSIWTMDKNGNNQRQLVTIPGSIDGKVKFEMDYLTHGWIEEQLSWSR